jgi:hypothetical protein
MRKPMPPQSNEETNGESCKPDTFFVVERKEKQSNEGLRIAYGLSR